MKKLLTGVIGLSMVLFISVGSISASSNISPTSCGWNPGQPSEICLERP